MKPQSLDDVRADYAAMQAYLGSLDLALEGSHAVTWYGDSLADAVAQGFRIMLDERAADVIERHKRGEAVVSPMKPDAHGCEQCGAHVQSASITGNRVTWLFWGHDGVTCPYADLREYSVDIPVPSGKMMVGNCLYAGLAGNDVTFALDTAKGRKEHSEWYAKNLGMANMNCSNGGLVFARASKGTQTSFAVYDPPWDEEADDCKEVPFTLCHITTDYWGYCVVDAESATAQKVIPAEKKHATVIPCKPGTYRFTHKTRAAFDDNVGLWTVIRRVRSSTKI